MLSRKTTLTILFSAALAAVIFAQSHRGLEMPNSPAGQRVSAYLKAFNSGDEKQMREFFANNVAPAALERRPIDARLQVYRQMRDEFQTLDLRRIVKADDASITVLLQTKSGDWLEVGFEFEATPPHKLVGFRVEDTEPPSGAASNEASSAGAGKRVMSEGEVVSSLDKYLEDAAKADEFSGAVLLAKNGKPLFQKAYGLASKEFNVPNRVDTKFNLGSINKIFTKVAIGQLVEKGKLSFDDKIIKHLPDYPNREAAEKVTIQHLLQMSSGIGDFFGDKFDATAKDRLRRNGDFIPLFAAQPLAFEPGAKRQYSNGGYIVLGAIIEKVSGQDYYDYVREHIFKPAGMENTDSYEADAVIQNLAIGYTREGANGRGRRNNFYTRPARGSSAGGGYSTAEDLLKFAIALSNNKLLSPEFTNWMFTGQMSPKAGGRGGFGFAGGAPGINATVEINSDSGYTAVVMSNYDPPSAERVGKQMREWLKLLKN
ncbi:MAG TPA: serine hydrolase domain-containing protein [Blastocatellia bacterium]|nr:serine hydrolase domain-containing protein [Blastocatellia bacterium]